MAFGTRVLKFWVLGASGRDYQFWGPYGEWFSMEAPARARARSSSLHHTNQTLPSSCRLAYRFNLFACGLSWYEIGLPGLDSGAYRTCVVGDNHPGGCPSSAGGRVGVRRAATACKPADPAVSSPMAPVGCLPKAYSSANIVLL